MNKSTFLPEQQLIENQFKAGARPIHPVHRLIRQKLLRGKVVKGIPTFDWTAGYDVRDTIGPIAIKQQGQNDSCGGQAASYFIEIQERLRGIKEGAISAKSIYAPIAYPGGGTTVSDLEGQISSNGANLEAVVPSEDTMGNALSESVMEDKSFLTSDMVKDALTRAGYTCVNVARDMDSVAQAIKQYGAVIWEIEGQNGHIPGWLSPTPQPPVPDNGQSIFAHFMCSCGAKTINGVPSIIALESMGTAVGDNGIQYFTQNYFDSGFIKDVFTFVWDGAIPVPVEPPQSAWPALAWWFAGWEALKQLFASGAGRIPA